MKVYHYRRTPQPRTPSWAWRQRAYTMIYRQLENGQRGGIGGIKWGYCGMYATPQEIKYIKMWFIHRFNAWLWGDYVRWRRGLRSLL